MKSLKKKILGVMLSAAVAISAFTGLDVKPADAAIYNKPYDKEKNTPACSIKNFTAETRGNGIRAAFDVKSRYPLAVYAINDDKMIGSYVGQILKKNSKKHYTHIVETLPLTPSHG